MSLDTLAKQRLTGAVILVALIVLLVPELLKGPKTPVASPPSDAPESSLRSYTIEMDPNDAPPQSDSAPRVDVRPADPASANQAMLPSDASSSDVMASAPPRAAANVVASDRASDSNRVDQRRAAPAVANRGGFVVQLGSFGSRANAERLQRTVTERGFSAFISPLRSNSRELFRVRVGPVANRAEAERLAAQLKAAGQTGSVVSNQ